jgi:hypothetical protein
MVMDWMRTGWFELLQGRNFKADRDGSERFYKRFYKHFKSHRYSGNHLNLELLQE